MDRIAEICLALLRFIFVGEHFPEEYKNLDEEEGKLLYAFSKMHDITHIVAVGIDKIGISVSDKVKIAFRKVKMAAFYRGGIMAEEQRIIEELLEKEKIRHIPLKGAVLRKLYPEEWMRVGSDIDILVDEENLEKIEKMFHERLFYKTEIKGNHDMSFITPSGVHIEMHFKLVANGEYTGNVIEKVWDYAVKAENCEYKYEMISEYFVFYHIVHMAKHMKQGGCGIRFFIDLMVIEDKIKYNEAILYELLECDKKLTFYKEMKNVLSLFINGKEGGELTERIRKYVLSGGVYGNAEHHVALKQRGKGSKLRYFWRRIFVKGSTLAYFYPKINKYPILTPYYQVKRWMKIFDAEKRKRAKYEMSINLRIKQDEVDATKKLITDLGI